MSGWGVSMPGTTYGGVTIDATEKRSAWPIAWSFPEWKCGRCGTTVRWADAFVDAEDGRLFAVRHLECAE